MEKLKNIELVEETILSFKNGKSPDEMHITVEHLSYNFFISKYTYTIYAEKWNCLPSI